MQYKTGMVFGVFDGIHPGHIFLLTQALAQVETLYVVVAADLSVSTLKSKNPQYSVDERQKHLQALDPRIQTCVGDTVHREWSHIKKIKPDVIFVGYDQEQLKEALEIDFNNNEFELVVLPAFEPEKYHSSLLNRE